MSQAGTFGTGGGGGGDVVKLTGNTGGAVSPDGSGNINVVGDGTTATVVGNPGTNTLTISAVGEASTFAADTGTATPNLGTITMHGAGDIATSATSHTVTFTGSGVTTVHSDSGNATASSNAITIAGGTNVTTSATGSTITINASGGGGGITTLDGDSGSATGATVTIAGGTGVSTSATGATVTINTTGIQAVTYVNTTPYVVLPTDFLLDVDCSGGAITIQLPDTAVEGQSFIVKDLTGSAATNNITVTTVSGSTTIDNSTFYTIATNHYSIQITGNSQSAYDIALNYAPVVAPSGITSITGDTGSAVSGSAINLITGYITGPGTQGTLRFNGNATTINLSTSDGNSNLGIGQSSLENSASAATFFNCVAYGDNSGVSMTNGATFNCLYGVAAGASMTSGTNNHAFGYDSLGSALTGSNNIAIGYTAGSGLVAAESNNIYLNNTGTASENNVLRIGSGTGTSAQQLNSSYISGIQTIVVTGTPVLISTSDQLGVAASSERFKNDIQTMNEESSAIHNLKPVTFVWNRNSSQGLKDAPTIRQTGLIAEEVHKVMPNLVILDKDQQPFSVKYEDLPALLLNELQKLKKSHDELAAQVVALQKRG